MKNFIESYDNALTSEQCKMIIDYMNEGVWSGLLKRGEMFGGIDIKKKDSWDMIMNMNEDTEVNDILYNSLCKCIDDYKIKNPHLNQLLPWYGIQFTICRNIIQVRDIMIYIVRICRQNQVIELLFGCFI